MPPFCARRWTARRALTVGWGWQPQTGELWAMDNGMDGLGDNVPPEELNRIEKEKRYGWPYLFGDNQTNPHSDPPGGIQKSDWAKVSTPMTLGYMAHAAPMQMSFYNASQFPAEYQGDAFVSMRGSWNRKPPAGYEVVRIHFRNGAISLDEIAGNASQKSAEVLALDQALDYLARVDARKARVIELRFFGGLSVEETAEVLQISPQSVMRDWKLARAWLVRELG